MPRRTTHPFRSRPATQDYVDLWDIIWFRPTAGEPNSALSASARNGQCFAVAAMVLETMPATTDWCLVHGTLHLGHGGKRPIAHAWLEDASRIYEPQENLIGGLREFCRRFTPRTTARYTRRQAIQLIALFDNFGPWLPDAAAAPDPSPLVALRTAKG
jgi:hypothetical protein